MNNDIFQVIDIWLLFFLITNAVVIAIHTIIDLLLLNEKKSANRMKSAQQIFYHAAGNKVHTTHISFLFVFVQTRPINIVSPGTK